MTKLGKAYLSLFTCILSFVMIGVIVSLLPNTDRNEPPILTEDEYLSGNCNHIYGEWYTSIEPTCTTKGTEKQICTICNYENTRDISTLAHSYEIFREQKPTCFVRGTIVYKCANCATSYVEDLPPTHNYSAPTCTENAICSDCGQIGEEALGHTEVTDSAVAPTCTETGLTEGSHCSVCNEVLMAQELISATGHKYEASEWTVLEEPTLNTNGTKVKKCEICEDVVEWGEVPALLTYTYNGTNSYMVSKGDTELTGVLEIPSHYMGVPVTEIGDFSGCTKITRVIIPDSVTSIGYMAFADCTSMTSVEIPNSIILISPYAFSNTLLYEVYIPDSVITMGDNVFRDCSSLHNGESRTSIYCGASSKPDGWAENWAGGEGHIEWGASPL